MPDFVANVIASADVPIDMPEGRGFWRSGIFWYDAPAKLHDENDPDDGPLFAQYGDPMGITIFAPDAADENEVERRVMRCLGSDVVIDDIQRAVKIDQVREDDMRHDVAMGRAQNASYGDDEGEEA